MKFSAWIAGQGVGDREAIRWAAERLGLEYQTARRILRGERLPDEEVMRRILALTKSAVQPNDFYNLEAPVAKAKRRA